MKRISFAESFYLTPILYVWKLKSKRQIESQMKIGWDDWAGSGQAGMSQYIWKEGDRLMAKAEKESQEKWSHRKDNKVYKVMI